MALKTKYEVGQIPHNEYPRPQLVRPEWKNLNGLWDYCVVDELIDTLQDFKYEGKILVPFAIESSLSQVEREFKPNQTLVYRTYFKHKAKSMIPLLHFDAVDYKRIVFLNGQKLCEHKGGYFNFTINIKDALKEVGDNELIVLVQDPSDTGTQQRGKQKLVHSGIWYTPTSGIWQSVWIENVPQVYIEKIKIKPDIDGDFIDLYLAVNDPDKVEKYTADISLQGKKIASAESELNQFRIRIKNPRLWSPENPTLYDITISCGTDEVQSYFGMRKFEMKNQKFYLNNKPYFITGALDQGYFPDGILTPPSDQAMIEDIEFAKSLGFNCLRKHIKIEMMRWYYHCDRLGMIVWQDMINGGGEFNTWLHILAPLLKVDVKDNQYCKFGRDDESRLEFKADLGRMVAQLYNVPSICLWGIFNEAWGQFDSELMLRYLKDLDNTRVIDATSGWYNQGNDLVSIHKYILPFKMPKNEKRTVALTEFGGYSYPIKGHVYSDKQFGYLVFNKKDRLNKAIERLYKKQIFKAKQKGLSACIYTQLTDVECEINGLITYDREVIKVDIDMIKRINSELTKENNDKKD